MSPVTPGTAVAEDVFTPNLQKNMRAQRRRAYQWLRACGRALERIGASAGDLILLGDLDDFIRPEIVFFYRWYDPPPIAGDGGTMNGVDPNQRWLDAPDAAAGRRPRAAW